MPLAFALGANRYAAAKDRRAHKTIKDKNLRIGFKAITFGSYGSFGTSTHLLINKATADAQQSVFNPWVRPGPRQHAYLLFGFSLMRQGGAQVPLWLQVRPFLRLHQ